MVVVRIIACESFYVLLFCFAEVAGAAKCFLGDTVCEKKVNFLFDKVIRDLVHLDALEHFDGFVKIAGPDLCAGIGQAVGLVVESDGNDFIDRDLFYNRRTSVFDVNLCLGHIDNVTAFIAFVRSNSIRTARGLRTG